jgi:cytochrome c553
MPTMVAHGRKPDIYACGLCHLTNGQGTHGTVNLAGLSAAYIVQQMEEMKSGRRRSSDLRRPGIQLMVNVASHATASDIEQAAVYFSSLHFRPWIRVVESRTVPKTRAAYWGWLDAIPHGGVEAIGQRIIELAEDPFRAGRYDPSSGFVANVPVGSLKRGKALVLTSLGRTNSCESCHGHDLRGVGDVPPLAGRFPSYLARQLWDIKTGSRSGPTVALMQAPVAQLSEADIVDITAYLASRHP